MPLPILTLLRTTKDVGGFDHFLAAIIYQRFLFGENAASILHETLHFIPRKNGQIFIDPPQPLGYREREHRENISQARDYLTMESCRVSNADSKAVVGFETRLLYERATVTFRLAYLMVVSEYVEQKYTCNRPRKLLNTSFPLIVLSSFLRVRVWVSAFIRSEIMIVGNSSKSLDFQSPSRSSFGSFSVFFFVQQGR